MMNKKKSPAIKLFRLSSSIPFLLVIVLVFCDQSSSMIPDELYTDVKLNYKTLPTDYRKTYKRDPILHQNQVPFTGTQNMYYRADDRLHSSSTYKEGYLSERLYFDKDGSQAMRYVYKFEDGYQILFQRYDKNDSLLAEAKRTKIEENEYLLLSNEKEWYNNGQLRYESSYYMSSERPAIYHGLMSLYDEQGTILQQELYKDGELIEKIK